MEEKRETFKYQVFAIFEHNTWVGSVLSEVTHVTQILHGPPPHFNLRRKEKKNFYFLHIMSYYIFSLILMDNVKQFVDVFKLIGFSFNINMFLKAQIKGLVGPRHFVKFAEQKNFRALLPSFCAP